VAEAKGSTTLDYMWYRSGVVAVLGWGLACSDAAPEPSASPEPEQEPITAPSLAEPGINAAAFQLRIEDWAEAIEAKAQLNVTEGEPKVRLQITGGGQRDILLLDVDFENLEGSMGAHRVAVGLPGGELDSAIVSLEGQLYHSQTGQIDVSLSADGSISGSFELAIAPDPEVAPGELITFQLSEDVRSLRGQFGGKWNLFCQSHMPGHMQSLIKGGDYCEALEF
jgi:hypothetical protein